MSETTIDPVTEQATEGQEGAAPIDATQVAADGQEGAEEGQEAAQDETKPSEEVQNKAWFKQQRAAIARQTRIAADARRELALAKSELDMLRAGKTPDPAETQATLTQTQIDAAAERKIAERETAQAKAALIAAGVKEMTAPVWDEKTGILQTLGALETPGFLDALLDIPEAPKLVSYLADEPDELAALLAKSPTKMATAMGRMAERLSVDTPKPISKVAAPIKPVGPGRVTPIPDVTKMSAKEYIEFRDRTAPKHLGGRGQAA